MQSKSELIDTTLINKTLYIGIWSPNPTDVDKYKDYPAVTGFGKDSSQRQGKI